MEKEKIRKDEKIKIGFERMKADIKRAKEKIKESEKAGKEAKAYLNDIEWEIKILKELMGWYDG